MPEVPSVFDDFFLRDLFQVPGFGSRTIVSSMPSVNVKETELNYELEIAAPGMKKEDFKVELDGQLLTISAEKKNEHETKEENYTRKEFNYASFKRSFTLPERMFEADTIRAKYVDGILYLTVPKTKEAIKPVRLIEVG